MHVHIGAFEFLSVAGYIVIFGFFWRSLSSYLAARDEDSTLATIGKAMSFIF